MYVLCVALASHSARQRVQIIFANLQLYPELQLEVAVGDEVFVHNLFFKTHRHPIGDAILQTWLSHNHHRDPVSSHITQQQLSSYVKISSSSVAYTSVQNTRRNKMDYMGNWVQRKS